MIKEQAILNIIHECGIRIANYSENCNALLNEATQRWSVGGHKPMMPFLHTNVIVNNDKSKGMVSATATVFYPFMLEIPSGTIKTTTQDDRSSLLQVANDNSDFIEDSISEVERNLEEHFLFVRKQGRSVFDVNFSSKYFGQADKTMFTNFIVFAYVCDYTLICDN